MTRGRRALISLGIAALPIAYWYAKGVVLAHRALEAHPERFPNPEQFRDRMVSHCTAGGVILAIPLFLIAFVMLTIMAGKRRTRKRPNQASEATSEPALGAASSSPQG